MELLGKRCHKLALLSPGASQAHPAAPVLPYSSPCPPCHSAILAVRVSATGVPAVPHPWPAVTVPADGCFRKEGDANQALDVSHITLAREGSSCRAPVQSQQQLGKVGEGREPGPNQQYGQHWEKNGHILRSSKEAKPAPQSLQLMLSSAAPGMCQMATWLLVTAQLGLLPHLPGSHSSEFLQIGLLWERKEMVREETPGHRTVQSMGGGA